MLYNCNPCAICSLYVVPLMQEERMKKALEAVVDN